MDNQSNLVFAHFQGETKKEAIKRLLEGGAKTRDITTKLHVSYSTVSEVKRYFKNNQPLPNDPPKGRPKSRVEKEHR